MTPIVGYTETLAAGGGHLPRGAPPAEGVVRLAPVHRAAAGRVRGAAGCLRQVCRLPPKSALRRGVGGVAPTCGGRGLQVLAWMRGRRCRTWPAYLSFFSLSILVGGPAKGPQGLTPQPPPHNCGQVGRATIVDPPSRKSPAAECSAHILSVFGTLGHMSLFWPKVAGLHGVSLICAKIIIISNDKSSRV